MAGDSTVLAHTVVKCMVPKYTIVAAKHISFCCTVAAMDKTTVVAETAVATVVHVTEKTSYGLGYHNRQSNRKNQSFPICKRNQISNTKGSRYIPYSVRLM